LVGVNVERMLMLGWGLASVIGTVAAMLTANLIVLEPSEMSSVLIFAFAAIVLGGLNSSVGAVVGGLLVGVVQSLASSVPFIGPSLNTAVAMALIVLVLIARPHGLFGRATVSRA
jgi:branched-chain amino acid transport system permease protein